MAACQCLADIEHQIVAYIRPGLKMFAGSNAVFSPRDKRSTTGVMGWNTSTPSRTSASARIKVAYPPCVARALRMSAAPASAEAGISSQTRPPDQSYNVSTLSMLRLIVLINFGAVFGDVEMRQRYVCGLYDRQDNRRISPQNFKDSSWSSSSGGP